MSKSIIVLVEDDLTISNMYKLKLESSGYEVRTAYNGIEGLNVIEACNPDLILLDIKMPLMDGAEMLKKLRETPKGRDISVVILTNVSRDEAPLELRLLNVDKYIVKVQITPTQLIDVISQLLENQSHKLHKTQD